jgi:hypothetical protein
MQPKTTLLKDIYSSVNRKQLGKQGETVVIISRHGHCLIVENSSKARYTVTENDIKKF